MTERHSWNEGAGATLTGSDLAVRQLQVDIIAGVLPPDAKLKLRELTERYGIGASPMREALARLSALGLVRFRGQQGFRVAPVSRADLLDITRSRQIVEPEVLKLAIAAGGEDWEAEIVKAFHLFKRGLEQGLPTGREALDTFEARHHDLHRALVAACPLETLRDFCDDLYLRKERYRRLLFRYDFTAEEVIAEHAALVHVVLSRDAAAAASVLARHIGLTADILLNVLPEPHAGRSLAGRGLRRAIANGRR
jgi:DNA-binding GntR family transcriptional regulator